MYHTTSFIEQRNPTQPGLFFKLALLINGHFIKGNQQVCSIKTAGAESHVEVDFIIATKVEE